MQAFYVFAAGDERIDATDVVDAAWFRGDLQPFWREFLAGIACERLADEEGSEPGSEALQTLSEDFRYAHDLITAEETDAWLISRNLTLNDLTGYANRRYWRERAIAPSQVPEIVYLNAEPDLRERFLQDLLFGGRFDELVRLLSWRVAGSVATVMPDHALSGRLEEERTRFFQRTALAPGRLSEWLQRLGRDGPWFETLLEQESRYGWNCDQVRTAENRARTLAALRLSLTCFDVEMMDLESADAAREACLCLTADGLSMEALAGQEHYWIEKRELLLEAFPQELQQRFLSAESGEVLQFITSADRFQVCRILNKREPAMGDESVLARLDAELIATHFGNLVSKHIVWLLERGSPA